MITRLLILIMTFAFIVGCVRQESTVLGIPQSVWKQLTPEERQNIANAQRKQGG